MDNADRVEHRVSKSSGRRAWDQIYYWMPILIGLMISLLSTLLTLGVLYGKLDGRMALIEYRLQRLEEATTRR
jgi:hypothetical protein